jgi:hypothetical protein
MTKKFLEYFHVYDTECYALIITICSEFELRTVPKRTAMQDRTDEKILLESTCKLYCVNKEDYNCSSIDVSASVLF